MAELLVKNLFHVHDKCNGHASTTVKDVVEYSIKNGYKKIVYTEHCPLLDNGKLFRPSIDDIKQMRLEISRLQLKYKNQIEIYFGYEAEYPKQHREYFQELAKSGLCDYMIFGNHFYGDMWGNFKFTARDVPTVEELDEYYEQTLSAFKSGLFSYFAHPDIWVAPYCHKYGWDDKAKELTQKLIDLAIEYDIPLGFNANGMHSPRDGFNYPSEYFWKMVANTKAKVLIEADAHHMKTLSVEWMNNTYNEAVKFGLKDLIVDDIPLKLFPISQKIKGAIFDLDGVLTETSELHYQAWKEILSKYNISLTREINEQVKGLARKDTLIKILEISNMLDKFSNEELDKICALKNDKYLELLKTLSPKDANPNIVDLLTILKAKKIKIALASSSKNAPLILKKIELYDFFDYIADPTQVKRSKPAPDIYLHAAQGINIHPKDCIGFEDALMGVHGLNDANIFSVCINQNKDIQQISSIAFNTTKDIDFYKIEEKFNVR